METEREPRHRPGWGFPTEFGTFKMLLIEMSQTKWYYSTKNIHNFSKQTILLNSYIIFSLLNN